MTTRYEEEDQKTLMVLLEAARPFLRGEEEQVDPELPGLVSVLRSAGAGECYHKHGTFLAHLVDVYRILRLWGAPEPVARCGLFHSSYSNSYVDLAIFHPDTGRDDVRAIIGDEAERLVHLFCVVPRHQLIHHDLLFRYTDQELNDHLAASKHDVLTTISSFCAAPPPPPPPDIAKNIGNANNIGNNGKKKKKKKKKDQDLYLSPWRLKLRSVVPLEGVVSKHIRTGEPVALSRRVLAVFLLITIADFSDQYTDYQDKLFQNDDGRLEFRGDNWAALWPGTGKPGLWLSAMSRLAAIYNLIARDDKILLLDQGPDDGDGGVHEISSSGEGLVIPIPPVFDGCTRVLDPDDQKAARDLYWEAICSDDHHHINNDRVESLLRESIAKNPSVGEPHLVLAQLLLNNNSNNNDDAASARARYEEAAAEAEQGLRLLLQWGSSWDKRMSWEGWVSWARVMRDRAKRANWPRSSWGIINLGLVDGVQNNNTTC